jgi:hypothetical protein
MGDGTTTLDVIYTNEPEIVDHILHMYEQLLHQKDNDRRSEGLDLEYTRSSEFKPPGDSRRATRHAPARSNVPLLQLCLHM